MVVRSLNLALILDPAVSVQTRLRVRARLRLRSKPGKGVTYGGLYGGQTPR